MGGALTGKVALVTGAARGIGRAVARKLADGGCDLAINYFNSHDDAERLCAEIRAAGRGAVAVQGNVAGAFVPIGAGLLLDHAGVVAVFVLIAAMYCVMAITSRFAPETHGRSLEDINSNTTSQGV